jgi:hypothetical protein
MANADSACSKDEFRYSLRQVSGDRRQCEDHDLGRTFQHRSRVGIAELHPAADHPSGFEPDAYFVPKFLVLVNQHHFRGIHFHPTSSIPPAANYSFSVEREFLFYHIDISTARLESLLTITGRFGCRGRGFCAVIGDSGEGTINAG